LRQPLETTSPIPNIPLRRDTLARKGGSPGARHIPPIGLTYMTSIDDCGICRCRWFSKAWCLSEALGPSNAELSGKQLQEITTAFAKAAVPQYSAICALECILQADCTTRTRTPRQRQHYLEQRLLEIEEAAWIEDVVDAVA
jgi:hypothetical protein